MDTFLHSLTYVYPVLETMTEDRHFRPGFLKSLSRVRGIFVSKIQKRKEVKRDEKENAVCILFPSCILDS